MAKMPLVAVSGPRGKRSTDLGGIDQFHTVVRIFEQRGRGPYRHYHDSSGMIRCGRQDLGRLQGGEGNGHVGLNCGARHLGGVGEQTRGNVHRNDQAFLAPRVDALHRSPKIRSNRLAQAGTEKRIHHDVGRFQSLQHGGRGRENVDREIQRADNFPVNKRIAFQLFRIPKEKHLRTPLAQCEMPRCDKSVSAVVPLAAEDVDPPGWKIRACL